MPVYPGALRVADHLGVGRFGQHYGVREDQSSLTLQPGLSFRIAQFGNCRKQFREAGSIGRVTIGFFSEDLTHPFAVAVQPDISRILMLAYGRCSGLYGTYSWFPQCSLAPSSLMDKQSMRPCASRSIGLSSDVSKLTELPRHLWQLSW